MFGIPVGFVASAICVMLFPFMIALAVRLLPKRRLAAGAERVEELERRVGELEAGQQRVAELEERLDFAERLLAKQRDAERLVPPKS